MSDQAKGPSAVKADKNPKGGLSAQGRKKFGVQKGVTNYSGASRKDKGRWVSWAMRFTGSPKPLKDAKGQPTRYALMFRAWGEKVPTSVADVNAVHAKAVKRSAELKNSDKAFSFAEMTDDFAESLECSDCDRAFLIYDGLLNHVAEVHLDEARDFNPAQRKQAASKGQAQKDGSYPIKNAQDLKNAIQAYGRSKNKAATKAHIIRRAKALGLTKSLPAGWGSKDKAMRDDAYVQHLLDSAVSVVGVEHASLAKGVVPCVAPDCGRSFRGLDQLQDHAEAVHTFEDIRRILSEYIREEFGRRGDYKTEPIVPGVWTWIDDLSADWVVFMIEEGNDSKLLKASYSITDGNVTLGDPEEVRRRTVYETVNKKDD